MRFKIYNNTEDNDSDSTVIFHISLLLEQ